MIIVFLGPPGAGKGTQCKILAANYLLQHLSSGDCLRREIKKGAELGLKTKAYMEQGQLVPDELVMSLMIQEIENSGHNGVILDGFPRTIGQARQLDEYLNRTGKKVNVAMNLDVDDKKLESRITGRRSCPVCGATYHIVFNPPGKEGVCDVDDQALVQRPDDTPEIVPKRISTYYEQSAPLVAYYFEKRILRTINGDFNIEKLTADMFRIIDGLLAVDENVRT